MDTKIIVEISQRTLAGTISFPDVVKGLLSAGVEYYHVDYVQRRKTFYSGASDVAVAPIEFEGLPAVAADFDVAGLKANILDSQRNGQKFRDFSIRALSNGVQGYYAFLRGQRVTYFGRNGDHHTEWFPGAKPATL
ncbi:MAG TPA: DUF1398 family protein [Opitutaceae bacterium]|nr:DUF1398 family protein [Opitutaceae bacterium]